MSQRATTDFAARLTTVLEARVLGVRGPAADSVESPATDSRNCGEIQEPPLASAPCAAIICSGVTANSCPIAREALEYADHCPIGRNRPGNSPGRPHPVARPKPNAR